MGGTYLLENPLNSLVALHPRYVWLVERLLEHNIPDPWLAFRASGKQGCVQTTTRYVDKAGKRRFVGNSNLKRSQQYTYKFASKIVQMVPLVRQDTMENKIPIKVSPESFMDLFGKMNFGEECKQWDSEADLVRVVQYVRGSKKLNIPREWRELIPKTIPI
ncbi:unnamed protein product [Cladocopium goreaui]|uniref:Uncharacterized protein n=1 Tax=Cladocopium goreaui TaxID=2562237 RepID=A0A9P1GBY2_9DINO|nr:unnamed protein product [Cladocopium goreaui]